MPFFRDSPISLPVLIIYPLVTLIIGLLLRQRLKNLRLREELLRSLTRLNTSQQLSKMGGWEWNPADQSMFWTDETYRIHGYDPENTPFSPNELVEKSVSCYRPEDRPVILAAFQACCEEGTPYDLEFAFTTVTGEEKWIRTRAEAKIENGKVVHIIGNIIDITERKQTESILKESEEKWRNVLIKTPQIGIALDPRACIVFANDHFLNLTGWKEEEILGQNWFDQFIPEDVREEVKSVFEQVMHSRDVLGFSSFENEILTRSGERRVIAWSNVITKNANNEVVDVTCLGIDLTERKRSEENLRLLSHMLDVAPNAITIHDMEGNFLYANKKCYELHGYSPEEFNALNLHQLDVPESETLIKERIDRIQTDGSARFEVGHYRKDGSIIPMEVYVKIVDWRDKPALLSIATDITERIKAEEAKRMSEDLSRIVFDKTSVGYSITNLEGSFLRVNVAFADMLGYTIEEMTGRNWSDFTLPEDIENNRDIQAPLLSGEKVSITFEKRYLRKDGSKVDVLINTTLLRDMNNAPMYFITSILDISERKKIEVELRESEERFRSLHNASFGGIAIHDKGIILECNLGLSEMMGYSLDELVGMDGLLLIAPDSRDLVRKKISSGDEKPYEAFGLRKNSEIFPMRLEARNIPYKGKNVRTVEFRDITEQKRVEEKIQENQNELQRLLAEAERSHQALLSVAEDLQESEDQVRQANLELEQRVKERTFQLEATNRELEAFSFSVSHDLRAPLRALDGFSDALATEYSSILDEQAQQYLSRIREASQRMGHLIDDLLNLSRISRKGLVSQEVDLSALAETICAQLKAQQPERPVEVIIDKTLIANGDVNLLTILFENLLANAFKFSGKNERTLIQIGSLQIQNEPTYFIRDNGVGFDMAYADKLFTPFQRLHTEREFPGTGIGLSIAQRIINKHGGRIWVESVLGEGTTFYFTLGSQ